MDGTVCDTFEVWLGIVQSTLGEYGISAERKTIIRKVFGNSREGLVDLGVPESALLSIFASWDDAAQESMKYVGLYEGAEEFLYDLKSQGKKLALVTATVRRTVDIIIGANKLEDVFDVVICGDEMKEQKPSPEALHRAMLLLDTSPGRTLMLGDSEKDLLAARNANIDSLLFAPPEHKKFHDFRELKSHAPKYIISSWRELL